MSKRTDGYALRLTVPEGDVGFVEYRRSFAVRGRLSGPPLPEKVRLSVTLSDENGTLLRHAETTALNAPFDPGHDGFLCVSEKEDPGHRALQAFGFPELLCGRKTPTDPDGERDAAAKCFLTETGFKAILVSATDEQHGAVRDDGMGMTGEDGRPFDVLPEGAYRLEVSLFAEDGEEPRLLARDGKAVLIGHRACQLICRFHPDEHRKRMEKWSREQGFSVISDPLPGYLDPYTGPWERHMGLLRMYRANDLALFADPRTAVVCFVYLLDRTSTSYETELAYLQSVRALEKPGRFVCYRYDIGEAELETRAGRKTGVILPFDGPSSVALCRADVLAEDACSYENTFRLDRARSRIEETVTDLKEAVLPAGRTVGVMGVIRPWQMDPEDFRENPDLTYTVGNCPAQAEYRIELGGETHVFRKPVGLERIPEGGSVYEFYHLFSIPDSLRGSEGTLSVRVIDRKGDPAPGAPAVYRFRVG